MRKCKCGSLEIEALGQCKLCYLKAYRNNPKNITRIKQQKALWYQKNKDLYSMKLKREKIYFDGKRETILKRDNYTCQKCGSIKSLLVHHKDRRGRGNKIPNNSLKNLETLCKTCHLNIHRQDILNSRKLRKNGFWSKTYKQCIMCGTTKVKHNSKGLCQTCYMQHRRGHKI